MNIALKDISRITTGLYAKSQPNGGIYCLQGRDFNVYKQLNSYIEPSLDWDPNIEKHFLNEGDIIIAAKGIDYFAYKFKNEVSPAVASSMFIVLRHIDNTKVLSDFITWYINHPTTQSYLSGAAKGTSIQSINKKTIENMEIPLPSIKKQQLIIEAAHLLKEEIVIKEQITSLKNKLINQQLFKAISQ